MRDTPRSLLYLGTHPLASLAQMLCQLTYKTVSDYDTLQFIVLATVL
jgi:hypothetical protein